jgi:hypothetical protein
MSKIKHFRAPLVSLSIVSAMIFVCSAILPSCDKTVENNIVARNGIPMSAAQENQTPAVVSNGTGTVNVSYDRKTHQLSYTVTWNNLTSDSIVGSHIHGVASRTQNAAVQHPFTIPASRSGTYSGVANVDGVKIKEDSLLLGYYYFNIHTNRYKSGEIRGQIEFQ